MCIFFNNPNVKIQVNLFVLSQQYRTDIQLSQIGLRLNMQLTFLHLLNSKQLYKNLMNQNQKSLSRLNWTQQEEKYLKKLREENGVCSWTVIANELGKVFQDKNRSGKQCRERYMNYIRFSDYSERIGGWTILQDKILFEKFLVHGRKWVQICKQMPGKSQNCLKNRFYGAMRKISRRIIRSFKQSKIKQKKILKQEAFIKILQCKTISDYKQLKCIQTANDFIHQLQRDLIKIAIMPQDEIDIHEIQEIVNRIHQLNASSKNRSSNRQQKYLKKAQTIQSYPSETQARADSVSHECKINLNLSCELVQKNEQNMVNYMQQNKSQQINFCDIRLICSFSNYSTSQDLQREVSEILNLEYVELNHELF